MTTRNLGVAALIAMAITSASAGSMPKLNLRSGFSAEIFAEDLEDARTLNLDGQGMMNVSGRPVGLLVLGEGSVLISANHAGRIYRVSYKA